MDGGQVYYGGKYGRWYNTGGYTKRPGTPSHVIRRGAILFLRTYRISLWDVTFSELWPPVFQDAEGTCWVCGPELRGTDLGSVPPDLQALCVDNSGHALPFMFHDYAWRHGGLFVLLDNGERVWRPLTRKQADKLLHAMLRAEGLGAWGARKVYWGVRAGDVWGLSRIFAADGPVDGDAAGGG